MKVEIISSRLDTYWYAKRIGEKFEVERDIMFPKRLRVVSSPNDFILEEDCLEVRQHTEKPQEAPERPPLGLRPEFIVLELRQKEIQEAVIRYMEAGKDIPKEWTAEYYRNNSRLLEVK